MAPQRVTLMLLLLMVGPAMGQGAGLPLRCPESDPRWRSLLSEVNHGVMLFQQRDFPAMRAVLAEAIRLATQDLHAAFQCSIGLATAYRVLALAHIGDGALQGRALLRAAHVALRLQHLANSWLIYAYNEDAHHDLSYIDGSAWPLTTREFDEEHHTTREIVAAGGRFAQPAIGGGAGKGSSPEPGPRLSVGIVTLCAYPADHPLPRLAGSNHRMYAARHGYDYEPSADASVAQGRPLAWGKISVMDRLRHFLHELERDSGVGVAACRRWQLGPKPCCCGS